MGQKSNCKCFCKSRKKCYFYCLGYILFAQETEEFPLLCTTFMFIKISGKFMYNISDSGCFHHAEHYVIKWHMQHCSIGRTYQTRGVFKPLSLNIINSALYDRNSILFLIPQYGCIEVIYISKSMEVQFYPWES